MNYNFGIICGEAHFFLFLKWVLRLQTSSLVHLSELKHLKIPQDHLLPNTSSKTKVHVSFACNSQYKIYSNCTSRVIMRV